MRFEYQETCAPRCKLGTDIGQGGKEECELAEGVLSTGEWPDAESTQVCLTRLELELG